MVNVPTDVLDKPFSLDGKPPQRESFGFGLSAAGTVQVSLQWQGGPLTVSLRPANGNAIDSKSVSGSKAEASFAVSAAQVAQNLIWFITVESPAKAQGQVHIVSPRADVARMNDASANAERQRQQMLNQPPSAQVQAALQARTASRQKEQTDFTQASHLRIRAHQQQLLTVKGGGTARAMLGGSAPAPVAVRAIKLGSIAGSAGRSALLGSAGKSAVSGTVSDVPYADTVAPQAIFPDTTLTVQGAHFQADDEVFIIMPTFEAKAQKTYVGANQMLLKVPGYTSTSPQTAYFYIMYKRNGQVQRTDNAFSIQLQPTTPVLSSIALSDPNDTGSIRPQKVLTLTGSGFASDDKVFIVVQNKESEAAHFDSSLNSDTQMLVTLPRLVLGADPGKAPPAPLPGAFADPLQVAVFVKRASGAMSNRLNVALAPELTVMELNMPMFANELVRDSHQFRDATGSDRTIAAGFDSMTGGFYVVAFHRPGWLAGMKEDDVIFATSKLSNRWVVKTAEMYATNCIGTSGDAQIIESAVGTERLFTKVHWWAEASGLSPDAYCRYWIGYTGEGPLGMPYK